MSKDGYIQLPIAILSLKTTEIYSFTFLEAGSSKSRCQQGHTLSKGSREGCFFVPPQLLVVANNLWHFQTFICFSPVSVSIVIKGIKSFCCCYSVLFPSLLLFSLFFYELLELHFELYFHLSPVSYGISLYVALFIVVLDVSFYVYNLPKSAGVNNTLLV